MISTRCKKQMNRILSVIILSFSMIGMVWSQPPGLDYWYQTNDGFAKCTQIGESGGYATWYKDNFDVVDMVHRQGELYAFITYSTSSSVDSDNVALAEWNSAACTAGLFRHDMVENKWVRVAHMNLPSAYFTPKLLTNGTDIIALCNYGNIYIFDETQPNGWRLLTISPLLKKQFFRVTQAASPDAFDWRDMSTSYNGPAVVELLGDTLFVPIIHHAGNCGQTAAEISEQGIVKINIRNMYVGFDSIGKFPGQDLCNLYTFGGDRAAPYDNSNARGWDGDHFDSYCLIDHIGGRFCLFAHYRDALDVDSCWSLGFRRGEYKSVQVLWVWDPKVRRWFNISQGPDWRNLTPSSCAGDIGMYPSWDKKRFFCTMQQGINEWRGDRWEFKVVGGSYNVGPVIPVYDPDDPLDNVTFYTHSRAGVELIDRANRVELGDAFALGGAPNCVHNNIEKLQTPDNGKTLYLVFDGMKYPNKCDWNSEWGAELGIYWLQPNPDKVASTINIHLQSATYLGAAGAGNNMAIGTGVAGLHHVVTGGNFNSPLSGRFKPGWTQHTWNGATTASRAKVIQMNMFADTIYSVTSLGNTMTDFDVQNYGQYRIVAAGDWGVSVLDSSGKNLIYTKSNTAAPLNSYGTVNSDIRVDIDDQGHVAVLKSETSFTVPGADLQFATFFVFDQNGNQVGSSKYIGSDEFTAINGFFSNWHIQDIAIHMDTVYVTGFLQDNMNGNYADNACDGGGLPVQSTFILAYRNNAGTWTRIWKTWAFDGDSLGRDISDCRGYKLNMGKDGKLYYLGWLQGTETVYRWNGKDCQCCNGSSDHPKTVTLRQFDLYNSGQGAALGSQAYFCTIDRKTGIVERGMMIIPRLTNGNSNTFASSRGCVHADQKGFVYVGGGSMAYINGRDLIHVNGQLLGAYVGPDPSIHIVNPDYTARIFWGAFNEDNAATGHVTSIGIRDNIIAALAVNNNGKLFTGATRYDPVLEQEVFKASWAMNPNPFRSAGNIEDTWQTVWYQDVWNHSQQDTLEPRYYTSQPVMPMNCFDHRAEFIADLTEVCVGQNVTFTDYSHGDKNGWLWKFGDGASLLPGTLGEGPWTVTYSTPGLKTVFLSMTDSCNNY